MKPNYRLFNAIIFDFDGVILDSEPIHFEACNYVLKDIGFNLDYEEFKKNYLGLADKTLFPQLLASKRLSLPLDKIDQMIDKKQNYFTSLIRNKKTLPVINGVAQYIKQAVNAAKKLAICSGAAQKEILTVLKKLEPDIQVSHFNAIVTADEVRYGKPSPEGYLLTAQKLGLLPNQCLVIEDSPHGIRAAKEAGMPVVALLTSYQEAELLQADYITRDFETLVLAH
ncbi:MULTISPECIES: HAD family hydrolase [unclassified Legionella]|uniref:HAD family hydrolase n=1 Tax=unclassified Legionella TaxID=2622702 RepID=UPI001E29F78F|nr:HAD family phosphatase [Legionella sp. 31fI33]MCC5014829.1 HAD family phosphatase [Legionella sp. 31fI33]